MKQQGAVLSIQAAPFATMAQALADINSRSKKEARFSVNIEGELAEDVILSGSINTQVTYLGITHESNFSFMCATLDELL